MRNVHKKSIELDEFMENYFSHSGVSSFQKTGFSSVEYLALKHVQNLESDGAMQGFFDSQEDYVN